MGQQRPIAGHCRCNQRQLPHHNFDDFPFHLSLLQYFIPSPIVLEMHVWSAV